jgi:hypothetical protein
MKKVINQKWILSAFLIAALGSQYYYSVSSQQILSSDFASTAVEGAVTTINVDAPTANSTQAVGAKEECADCETLTLSHTEADALRNLLKSVNSQSIPSPVAPAKPEVAAVADDSPEALCADERTSAGKALCIRREKANLQKEQDEAEMDLRNQEFEDKMADYADRYSDNLDTLVSRFESLMRTYSGRKKIDPNVAKKVFVKYIEPLLRKKMNASSGSPEDVAALHDLISEISSSLPAEYRSINSVMALDIKAAAEARAAAVHGTLDEARQAYNDKDYIHSQELLATARQNREQLLAEYNGNMKYGITGYFDMLSNTLSNPDDQSNANLIPSVRALFTNMNNESQNFLNVNGNGDGSSSGSRGGRGTAPSASAPITTNSVGPNLPNVSFGSPTQNRTGTRGSRN